MTAKATREEGLGSKGRRGWDLNSAPPAQDSKGSTRHQAHLGQPRRPEWPAACSQTAAVSYSLQPELEVQTLLRGVLTGSQCPALSRKEERLSSRSQLTAPTPYFCLRSAMKVGTETKHKGQAGNWPKLQWEVQTLVSPATKECWLHSRRFQEPRATPAPEPSCRLLPPGARYSGSYRERSAVKEN